MPKRYIIQFRGFITRGDKTTEIGTHQTVQEFQSDAEVISALVGFAARYSRYANYPSIRDAFDDASAKGVILLPVADEKEHWKISWVITEMIEVK